MDSALSIYGKPALPKEVSERLVLELSAIIANGYATCFQNHITIEYAIIFAKIAFFKKYYPKTANEMRNILKVYSDLLVSKIESLV